MELDKIATVIIGILVNREANDEGQYKYNLFNLKNYEEGIYEYSEIGTKNNFDNKLTKKGDIIFRLVCPNKIVYIDEKNEGLIISSQLCIIRPNPDKIDSLFLKWYLESELCREQLLLNVTGSSIQKVSVNALRKFWIPQIDLEKQKKISNLIELSEKERNVMKKILDTKQKLYNGIIEEIIKKEGARFSSR